MVRVEGGCFTDTQVTVDSSSKLGQSRPNYFYLGPPLPLFELQGHKFWLSFLWTDMKKTTLTFKGSWVSTFSGSVITDRPKRIHESQ